MLFFLYRLKCSYLPILEHHVIVSVSYSKSCFLVSYWQFYSKFYLTQVKVIIYLALKFLRDTERYWFVPALQFQKKSCYFLIVQEWPILV